jgi:hypothetical protein
LAGLGCSQPTVQLKESNVTTSRANFFMGGSLNWRKPFPARRTNLAPV